MKKLAVVVFLSFIVACPGFTNCPGKDVYATARAIIAGTQTAVQMSDAVFMAWAATQSDPEKIKKALATFTKIKMSVLEALQVAMDGVDIAQQAKEDPDISKLMVKAEAAFQDLRKFLETLLKKEQPASMPKEVVKPSAQELFDQLPQTLLKKK